MRILIIDDNAEKRAKIEVAINRSLVEPTLARIDSSECLSEAVRLISQNLYDLIILDLLLPYLPGGETDYRAGLELLRVIKGENQLNAATAIFGLSAYPEEIKSSRYAFEGEGVLLVRYSDDDAWEKALYKLLRNVVSKPNSKQIVDFAVVVALSEEKAALEKAGFALGHSWIVNGLNAQHAELDHGGITNRGVIILLPQMGLVTSTLFSAVVLNTFTCDVICMSGICAGFADQVELGQVILASFIWEYQAGKWSNDGFQIAPSQIPMRSQTRTQLTRICEDRQIIEFLEAGLPRDICRPSKSTRPALMPFATGSAVVAQADQLKHIQIQHRQIGGIDMEAYGLYVAAHELAGPIAHFFAAKCVVDFADRHKGDDLHAYGSFVSARMVVFCLSKLLSRN